MADADSIVDFGKGVTIFEPYLIFLQKEFAQQLLTHVNPYTGLSLANDPVMAEVEITNENSLYRMWRENRLKPFSLGGSLIIRHVKMLDSLWINFLIEKYSTTQNLASVWNTGIIPPGSNNKIVNGNFESLPLTSNWTVELHETASASFTPDNVNPFNGTYSCKVTVDQVTGTSWHIQFKQINLSIEKDSAYTVEFAARSEDNRNISVTIMKDTDPYTVYSSRQFLISSEWQMFSFSFSSPETTNQTRISFQFENNTGDYWFDDVKLSSAEAKGLEEGESLETRTVRRIDFADCVSYTNARVKDMSEFYIKLQDDYYSEMYNYLKNDLNVKVPIVGTNWNIGPGDLITQSKFDFIDNHSYWDHPSFPVTPWDSNDWLISNTPMVQSTDGGTIPGLFSGVPFAGKPFTVSEYNHSFPNRYQSEALLFTTAYSSFHNADALMFFDYSGSSTDWETDKVNGYFDIHRNSVMMGLNPSCAFAFRNHLIARANTTLMINYSPDTIFLLPKIDGGSWTGVQLFSKKLGLKSDQKPII